MANSVQVTIKGAVDETATSQTGVLAGSGSISFDIKDMSKTSIGVDYKDQDKLKISLQSEESFKFNADQSLTLSGGITYDALHKSVASGKAGIDFEISKDVAMSMEQSFNKDGNTISGKLTFSF